MAAGTSAPLWKCTLTRHFCNPSCTCCCRVVPHLVQIAFPSATTALCRSCLHSPGTPHGDRRSSKSLELLVAALPQVAQLQRHCSVPAADLGQPASPTGPATGRKLWTPTTTGKSGHTNAARAFSSLPGTAAVSRAAAALSAVGWAAVALSSLGWAATALSAVGCARGSGLGESASCITALSAPTVAADKTRPTCRRSSSGDAL